MHQYNIGLSCCSEYDFSLRYALSVVWRSVASILPLFYLSLQAAPEELVEKIKQ